MLIDLHCHTLKTKDGDPETRNVSLDIFKKKVSNVGVKILAITNHNAFDIEQYRVLREGVKDYCDVWPGIEIDAYGDSMTKKKYIRFHLIVVANPNQVEQFSRAVNEMMQNENANTFCTHIKEVCKRFEPLDTLFIPHFIGKKPSITSDDLELLKGYVKDISRVFTETTDSSIGVLINYGFHALVGSDVQDWNTYEECSFSELRLPVSSFEQFCMLSKRDAVVIDTILNKKKSYNVLASPHCKVSFELKIYEDINIIFGQKGTGKSEILNSLYSEMIKSGMACAKYVGSQKEDGFQKLLNTADMKRSCELMGIENCENFFNGLREWREPNITLFSKYIRWYETRNNNENKKRMRITDAIDLPSLCSDALQCIKQDKKGINEAIKRIDKIELEKYISKKSADELLCLIDELRTSIVKMLTSEYSQMKIIELTNYSVNRIKELADMKTDTVSKPSTTGFLEFAKRHLEIKKSIEEIEKAMSVKEYCEDKEIGELEGKGKILIRARYRMLRKESKTKEFTNGINNLKQITIKMMLQFY